MNLHFFKIFYKTLFSLSLYLTTLASSLVELLTTCHLESTLTPKIGFQGSGLKKKEIFEL